MFGMEWSVHLLKVVNVTILVACLALVMLGSSRFRRR
jgi:hypothetical protein